MTETDIEVLRNNPLHGLKLDTMLNQLVDHYGWEVLAQAVNINCFKTNPSIPSSIRFLKKTIWAREKLEGFYLYKFKRLPKADDENYELPPRDRVIPLEQQPRTPAVITLEIAPEPSADEAPVERDTPTEQNTPVEQDGPVNDKRAEMIKRVWGKS